MEQAGYWFLFVSDYLFIVSIQQHFSVFSVKLKNIFFSFFHMINFTLTSKPRTHWHISTPFRPSLKRKRPIFTKQQVMWVYLICAAGLPQATRRDEYLHPLCIWAEGITGTLGARKCKRRFNLQRTRWNEKHGRLKHAQILAFKKYSVIVESRSKAFAVTQMLGLGFSTF